MYKGVKDKACTRADNGQLLLVIHLVYVQAKVALVVVRHRSLGVYKARAIQHMICIPRAQSTDTRGDMSYVSPYDV